MGEQISGCQRLRRDGRKQTWLLKGKVTGDGNILYFNDINVNILILISTVVLEILSLQHLCKILPFGKLSKWYLKLFIKTTSKSTIIS